MWHGPIWNLRLTDNSPIQNEWANFGDASRYGVLDDSIVIPAGNALEIEFEWIRQDTASGTGLVELMGNGGTTSEKTTVSIWDSGSSNPDTFRVDLLSGNAASFAGALSNVAQGQHCSIKFVQEAGPSPQQSLYVDGELIETRTQEGGQTRWEFDRFGWNSNIGRQLPTGSALKNIRITDLTEGKEWFYPLDPGEFTASSLQALATSATLSFPLTWATTLRAMTVQMVRWCLSCLVCQGLAQSL